MGKRKLVRAAKPLRSYAPADGEKIVTDLGEVDFTRRTISNSMRTTFQDCRQRFMLSYLYNLRKRGLKDYFWVGGVIHEEWALMYEELGYDRAASNKRINKKMRTALKECTNEEQEKKIWKASAIAQGMLPVYAEEFLEKDLDRFELVGSEDEFEVPIPGTSWTYIGSRDLTVKVRKTQGSLKKGQVGIFENKTTADISMGYVAKLPLDFQILGYAWAHSQEYGKPPSFVMYNAAKKTALRQKQTETFGQYLDRIEQDYRMEPGKYFYREPLKFSKTDIDGFVSELVGFINTDLEPSLEKRFFSKNTRQCTIQGMCDFMEICSGQIPLNNALMMYERKRR